MTKLGPILSVMTSHFAPDQDGYVEPEFTLGDRLRKAREIAGLSQDQLAAELGVSKNTISNYEGGKGKPRHATLVLWSMRTRVSLDWLKGESNGNPPPVKAKRVGRETATISRKRPRSDSNGGPVAYKDSSSRLRVAASSTGGLVAA